MRSQRLYLRDLLDALDAAVGFVEGRTFEQFEGDLMAQFAVARALEIVDEATRALSPELKARYPEVPWRLMQALRNRLAHVYFGTNLNIVWKTVTESVPATRPLVARVLAELPPDA